MPTQAIVMQADKQIAQPSMLRGLIATLVIYSCVVPFILIDLWVNLYQAIYFTTFEIPAIPRRDYFVIDRHQLRQLTVLQKINCAYCGYVNGLTAWLKAVANQTEIYNCAIKHKAPGPGQDHHHAFADYEQFA